MSWSVKVHLLVLWLICYKGWLYDSTNNTITDSIFAWKFTNDSFQWRCGLMALALNPRKHITTCHSHLLRYPSILEYQIPSTQAAQYFKRVRRPRMAALCKNHAGLQEQTSSLLIMLGLGGRSSPSPIPFM